MIWETSSDRTGLASAEITLKYLVSEIAFLGDESGFTILSAQEPAGARSPLPTTRRLERTEVSAPVTGFSYFAIAAHPNSIENWETYK